MSKLPLVALGILAFVGLLAAAPALAAGAPPAAPAPPLCFANASPAVGAPAPQPVLINLNCGVCSDSLCQGKKAGATCGAGPAYFGFRCLNDSPVCSFDGLQTCNCELA